MLNSELSGSLSSEERKIAFENSDSVSYSMDNLLCKQPMYSSSILTPVTNAVVLDHCEDPSEDLIEGNNITKPMRLSSANSRSSRKSFSTSDLTKQVNDFDINDKPQGITAYDMIASNECSNSKDDNNVKIAGEYSVSMPALYREHTIREESISVPYLSPIVLQKELESLIENHGSDIFLDPAVVDNHGTVYWNLVYRLLIYSELITHRM